MILLGEDAQARGPVGVVRPGETVNFCSNIAGTNRAEQWRSVARGMGLRWVWDHNRNRRELPGDHGTDPTWEEIFGAFYSGESLDRFGLGSLLRSNGIF